MAEIKFDLGQVGITDYLIVNVRKVSDPIPIVQSQVLPPPQPTTHNFVFAGLDAVTYYVDFRESVDGVDPGLLLSTFLVNAANNIILFEARYYKVGSGIGASPNPGTDLVDGYLDGKDIFSIYKEGFRPLVPPSEIFKEYDLIAGGGARLLNGLSFVQDEVIVVNISYLGAQIDQLSGGVFTNVMDVPANITIGSTHYNKRMRCESAASSHLVITFPMLTTIPDGTAFYFMSNGGNQNQTQLFSHAGETFKYFDSTYTELSIGKGEHLWIEKRIIGGTAYLEVVQAHAGVLQVGERFNGQIKDHPNAKPRDGALYDGDDYPRIWWWIKNKLPVNYFIVDDTVTSGGYVHPADKKGQIVIHSTLKKFRVPNSQNLFERAIKNVNALGSDGERLWDYPGGIQNDAVKSPGIGAPPDDNAITGIAKKNGVGGKVDGWISNNAPGTDNYDPVALPYDGIETRPIGEGIIPLIRF